MADYLLHENTGNGSRLRSSINMDLEDETQICHIRIVPIEGRGMGWPAYQDVVYRYADSVVLSILLSLAFWGVVLLFRIDNAENNPTLLLCIGMLSILGMIILLPLCLGLLDTEKIKLVFQDTQNLYFMLVMTLQLVLTLVVFVLTQVTIMEFIVFMLGSIGLLLVFTVIELFDFPEIIWWLCMPPWIVASFQFALSFYVSGWGFEDIVYHVGGNTISLLATLNYTINVAVMMLLHKSYHFVQARYYGLPKMVRPTHNKFDLVVFRYSSFPRTDALLKRSRVKLMIIMTHLLLTVASFAIMIWKNI